ncbi:MAG: protein kinase [Anaerolineae bacterium]|nr:protein kinase [Anaerolineae bacterium]
MTSELVGKTIGGYKLVETMGAGGLAVVYKAYQPNLKRWVAVKVLHHKDSETLIRFQREAQAIARLRHRNIVIVYEYGEQDSWPYIAMEYIEGGTLANRLQGQPLDWVKVTNLAIALAEALDYAHQNGLVHRDVKPSNILMAQEDWPLLADFGLVKLPDAEFVLTGTGVSMGTPAYVAPEQARGVAVDSRSDMYSLGVVMFEMLTGRLPFDYPNPNKILLAHISEPVPSPRQFNPACPVGLQEVILTAMQKSPVKRYGDMQLMGHALKDVLASSKQRPAFYASPPSSQVTTLKTADLPGQAARTAGPEPAPCDARLFLVEPRVTIPLPDQENLIVGRTHRQTVADIDLGPHGAAEAGVSRRHARLLKQSDGWFIDDLDSLNGTYVNEVKVKPGLPLLLKDGDLIRCSHFSFLFLITAKT